MLGRYRIRKYNLDGIKTYDWLCIFGSEFDLMNTNNKSFPMSTSMKRLYLKRAIRTPLSTIDKIENYTEANLIESIPILFDVLGIDKIESTNKICIRDYSLRSMTRDWNSKLLMGYEVLPIPLTDDEIRYAIFINEYPISLLLQDTN